MGERVAHLVTGRMHRLHRVRRRLRHRQDHRPPRHPDKPLADSALRTRHGVTVVGVKKPGEDFTYATPDTVLEAGDLLIVSGPIDDVEAFAERT